MKLKNYVMPFIVMLGLVTFNSCSKSEDTATEATPTPTPDFTFTLSTVQAPSTVTFTNTSKNATSYLWDFNDKNATSSQVNPQHTFSTGGSYSVKLTATSTGGTTSVVKTVTIGAVPTTVTITKVTVTAMPFADSLSKNWDASDGPDVFFKIKNQTGGELFESSGTRTNDVTSTMLPLNLSFSPAFDFTSITAGLFIDLWDYDTSPDANDHIGYVNFLMNDYSTGTNIYPSTVTKTQNGITITLNLTWK